MSSRNDKGATSRTILTLTDQRFSPINLHRKIRRSEIVCQNLMNFALIKTPKKFLFDSPFVKSFQSNIFYLSLVK